MREKRMEKHQKSAQSADPRALWVQDRGTIKPQLSQQALSRDVDLGGQLSCKRQTEERSGSELQGEKEKAEHWGRAGRRPCWMRHIWGFSWHPPPPQMSQIWSLVLFKWPLEGELLAAGRSARESVTWKESCGVCVSDGSTGRTGAVKTSSASSNGATVSVNLTVPASPGPAGKHTSVCHVTQVSQHYGHKWWQKLFQVWCLSRSCDFFFSKENVSQNLWGKGKS